MKALFVRDMVTQRWVILLASVYSLFFFGIFAVAGESFGSTVYVISAVISGMIISLGSFKADKNNTLVLMLSLPETKTDVVNEKFLLLGVSTAFGLVAAGFFGLLLRSAGVSGTWITPLDFMRAVAGAGLLSAMIPVYLRFGEKAVRVVMVAILVVGVLLQLVLALVLALSPSSFTDVIDRAVEWYTRTPVLRRNLWWLAAGVGTLAVSYTISAWFYPRRDV